MFFKELCFHGFPRIQEEEAQGELALNATRKLAKDGKKERRKSQEEHLSRSFPCARKYGLTFVPLKGGHGRRAEWSKGDSCSPLGGWF